MTFRGATMREIMEWEARGRTGPPPWERRREEGKPVLHHQEVRVIIDALRQGVSSLDAIATRLGDIDRGLGRLREELVNHRESAVYVRVEGVEEKLDEVRAALREAGAALVSTPADPQG